MNYIRTSEGQIHIEDDWYSYGLPGNIKLSDQSYINSSFGFTLFQSKLNNALIFGKGSGSYDNANFICTEEAKIVIGNFNIFQGSTLICQKEIKIESHCMFSWGSIVTDCWLGTGTTLEARRNLLISAASSAKRIISYCTNPKPVHIEDNVWVGFGAIIMPGVKLGRGCIIGCKTVITEDVPPYAVMAGDPARLVRYLKADDTDDLRKNALLEFMQ